MVRDERVHAVDGDEFFGEGVGHAALVGAGAGDAGDAFARGDAAEEFVEALAHQAPPVGVHGDLEGRVVEDCGRPFDGVDLGHEGTVDEPGRVEELVRWPVRVGRVQLVADGVVLRGEERVHQFEPDPPVVVEARVWDVVRVAGEEGFRFGGIERQACRRWLGRGERSFWLRLSRRSASRPTRRCFGCGKQDISRLFCPEACPLGYERLSSENRTTCRRREAVSPPLSRGHCSARTSRGLGTGSRQQPEDSRWSQA